MVMSVQGPCPSQQVPVSSVRCSRITKGEARQTLERNQVIYKKSQDSLRDDDSLTSLEWLSSLGNPTSSILPNPIKSDKSNNHDLILLSFRLARQSTLSMDEITEMVCRINSNIHKNDVFNELNSSSAFVSCHNGWKLASSGMPPESKKRKVEMTYEISNGMGFDNKMDTENTIDIVIDRSAMKRQQVVRQNSFCPDLSDLLSEIGLPTQNFQPSSTNPFMQTNLDSKISETSMAHHLPVLEVCGERIPTPIDWTREEHSLGHISSPDSTDDLLINDVETPYMVESWLQDTFLDYSN